jgi:hypothetical protein
MDPVLVIACRLDDARKLWCFCQSGGQGLLEISSDGFGSDFGVNLKTEDKTDAVPAHKLVDGGQFNDSFFLWD